MPYLVLAAVPTNAAASRINRDTVNAALERAKSWDAEGPPGAPHAGVGRVARDRVVLAGTGAGLGARMDSGSQMALYSSGACGIAVALSVKTPRIESYPGMVGNDFPLGIGAVQARVLACLSAAARHVRDAGASGDLPLAGTIVMPGQATVFMIMVDDAQPTGGVTYEVRVTAVEPTDTAPVPLAELLQPRVLVATAADLAGSLLTDFGAAHTTLLDADGYVHPAGNFPEIDLRAWADAHGLLVGQ